MFTVAFDGIRADQTPIDADPRFVSTGTDETARSTEANAAAEAVTATPQPTATRTSTAMPGGTPMPGGLRGEYFDNQDLTGSKLVRTDPVVDFAWGTGSPDPLIGPDSFSVRWTG